MDLLKKMSILVFVVCIVISLKNQRAPSDLENTILHRRNLEGDEWVLHSDSNGGDEEEEKSLVYDFYTTSCPSAERIIRSTVRELQELNNDLAPELLRLAFHDCYVMGCDASLLLESDGEIKSEKEALPNHSIKGFVEIDAIKSILEKECPAIVSCADIVVLAAREAVLLAGGDFFPVLTGRTDSKTAFPQNALAEIPAPDFNIYEARRSFAQKGFSVRQMVALLGGGHSTGKIHCNFIQHRLFNFSKTSDADPAIDAEFLEVLRSKCNHSSAEMSLRTSIENRAMKMDYEGAGKGFGEVYYRSLMEGKGLLFVDQQLTSDKDIKEMVEMYASDNSQFRRDFAFAMFKLTHLQLTRPTEETEIRRNCRKLNKAD